MSFCFMAKWRLYWCHASEQVGWWMSKIARVNREEYWEERRRQERGEDEKIMSRIHFRHCPFISTLGPSKLMDRSISNAWVWYHALLAGHSLLTHTPAGPNKSRKFDPYSTCEVANPVGWVGGWGPLRSTCVPLCMFFFFLSLSFFFFSLIFLLTFSFFFFSFHPFFIIYLFIN